MALSDRLHRRGNGGREEPLLTTPFRLIAFDSLASTNDEAMARLKAGDPGELWITAATQTGGRGRQGRAWASPAGNLYASLALRLDVPLVVAPQLGFVAGVALAGVLRARLGADRRLRIKWPNDMIFAGAKLAGLLLDSATLADGKLGCVVGFGVNCRSHPDGLAYPATDLAAAGDLDPDPAKLVNALAAAMAYQRAVWDKGARFAEIRSAWLALAVDPGTRLAVALPDRQVIGTFESIDPGGRLLLATDAGRVIVDAGDVFLPELNAKS